MMRGSLEEHSVEQPKWVSALVDKVLDSITPYGVMGPLAFRWWEPCSVGNVTDRWVIVVYPTPNELFGGPHDGDYVVPGFKLNLSSVLSEFSDGREVSWNTPEVYDLDLDGPEIAIKGEFMSCPVWLRIFSAPPRSEPPSFVIDVKRGRFWRKPS